MGDSSRDQGGGGEIACIWQCVCVCLFGGEAGVQQGHNGASASEGINEGLHPWHTGESRAQWRVGDYETEAKAEEAEGEGAAPELRREQ